MAAVGIGVFFNDPITVETFAGEAGNGKDTFLPPVTIYGYSEQRRTLVRSSDSEIAVGQTIVYTDKKYAGAFTVGSKVTVNGVVSKVITTATFASTGLPLPEHIAVTLG